MVTKLVQDRWLLRAAVVGIFAIALMTILYIEPVYEAVGYHPVSWIYNVGTILIALAGAILSWLLFRSSERGEPQQIIWGTMGLGLFLWTVGETIWGVYELILNKETPFPSIADVAWTLGYIPLFISLYIRYRSLGISPTRKQVSIGLSLFAVLVVISVIFVIGPMIADPGEWGLIGQILSILYPVGDLAVAFGAGLIVLLLMGGTLSRSWVAIAAGFGIAAFADLLFVYTDWNGDYVIGEGISLNLVTAVTDVLYFAGYVLIVFGIFTVARLQRVL
jgi:hypothetical protein